MSIGWIIVLVLIFSLAFTGVPTFGYWNHGMGWYPSGGLGLVLIVLLVLVLSKRL